MSGSIAGFTSGVTGAGFKSPVEFQQNPASGGRSFESVLRGAELPTGQTPQAPSGAQSPEATAQSPLRAEALDVNVRQELTRLVLNEEARTQDKGLFGLVSQIEKANLRSDAVLKELSTNKDLSQGDLLVMQAMVYKAAQSTEVLSKVVDQVTGSVKTILNTNV